MDLTVTKSQSFIDVPETNWNSEVTIEGCRVEEWGGWQAVATTEQCSVRTGERRLVRGWVVEVVRDEKQPQDVISSV